MGTVWFMMLHACPKPLMRASATTFDAVIISASALRQSLARVLLQRNRLKSWCPEVNLLFFHGAIVRGLRGLSRR